MHNKDIRFARYGTTVIGLNIIKGNVSSLLIGGSLVSANRNRRRAANGNRRRSDVRKAA